MEIESSVGEWYAKKSWKNFWWKKMAIKSRNTENVIWSFGEINNEREKREKREERRKDREERRDDMRGNSWKRREGRLE